MKPRPRTLVFSFTILMSGCTLLSTPLNPPLRAGDDITPAMAYDFGVIHAGGIETPHDIEQAKAFFLQAAKDKHAPALTALGDLVQKTAPVPKPYDDIVSYYREAADLGNARAKFMMGRMTSQIMPEKDSKKSALQWFLESDEGGYTPAAYEIGSIYEQRGDHKEAYAYYFKAAKGGNSEAKLALSDLYTFGRGVKQDKDKGFLFLKDAADTGNPIARLNLGHVLKKKGLYFDLVEAGKWYAMAAHSGMKPARDVLEINRRTCIDNNLSAKDRAIACPIAAAMNDAGALFTLSALLRTDIPSPAHAIEAHKWALASATLGYEPARLLVMEDFKSGYGTPVDMDAHDEWENKAP